MIIDKLLSPAIKVLLSSFTASANQLVGASMDFGIARNNGLLSLSDGPGWLVSLKGATSAGASTAQVRLVTSASADLSSPTVLWTSASFALADIAGVGKQLWVEVPDTDEWKQFVGFQITVGSAVFTGGTISAQFAANKRKFRAYKAQGNT